MRTSEKTRSTQKAKSPARLRASPERYSRRVKLLDVAGAGILSSSQPPRSKYTAFSASPGDFQSGAGKGWSKNAVPTPVGVNHAAPPVRPGLVKTRGQERASKARGSLQNFRLPSAKRGRS